MQYERSWNGSRKREHDEILRDWCNEREESYDGAGAHGDSSAPQQQDEVLLPAWHLVGLLSFFSASLASTSLVGSGFL